MMNCIFSAATRTLRRRQSTGHPPGAAALQALQARVPPDFYQATLASLFPESGTAVAKYGRGSPRFRNATQH